MDSGGENPRGVHAIRVLERQEGLHAGVADRAAAYDSYLPAFDRLLPPLVAAYDRLPRGDPLRAKLAEQIALLRGWDYRWSADVGADVAGRLLGRGAVASALGADARAKATHRCYDYIATRSDAGRSSSRRSPRRRDKLTARLRHVADAVGRHQPLPAPRRGDIVQHFDDAEPSIPVPFTSARWGSLASFGARTYPGTKKLYGTSGNSFVAVVEFHRGSERWRLPPVARTAIRRRRISPTRRRPMPMAGCCQSRSMRATFPNRRLRSIVPAMRGERVSEGFETSGRNAGRHAPQSRAAIRSSLRLTGDRRNAGGAAA